MDEIIIKRTVYNPEGKPGEIMHTVKIPERIARDDIYDYNYYITEDDDYYQPKIRDSNVTTTTTTKQ
jgi:hypothetical protein